MPTDADSPDITALLAQWRDGDRAAHDMLMRVVYPVLRDMARARLRQSPGEPTLRATELVNEAYAKLVRASGAQWQNRMHFFAVAVAPLREQGGDVGAVCVGRHGGDDSWAVWAHLG